VKHQVTVIETHEFTQQAATRHLSVVELDAIRHLLAAKPNLGEPSAAHPEIFNLSWGAHDLRIIYLVSQDVKTLYLLTIETAATTRTPQTKPDDKIKKPYSSSNALALVLE